MKFRQHVLLGLICSYATLSFCGCGDEPPTSPSDDAGSTSDGSGTGNGISTSIDPPGQRVPSAPSRADEPIPSRNWIGNSALYLTTFEERYENREIKKSILVEVPDEGEETEGSKPKFEERVVTEPVEAKRLYVRTDGQPFDGRITRLYLSGSPEHQADFDSGFRKGMAYWWSLDGKLTRVAKGWGRDLEELDANSTPNPFDEAVAEVGKLEPDSRQSVFRGSARNFEEWNKYDSKNRLTDRSTGELVTGQVKLYGDDGKLQSEANYKDGVVHGFTNSYHSNGVQATKTVYSNGEKAGTETWWGDNGFKSYEANYVGGEMNGLETIWSDDGSISSQLRYAEGKLVESVYTKE
jgi:hypothetical protein